MWICKNKKNITSHKHLIRFFLSDFSALRINDIVCCASSSWCLPSSLHTCCNSRTYSVSSGMSHDGSQDRERTDSDGQTIGSEAVERPPAHKPRHGNWFTGRQTDRQTEFIKVNYLARQSTADSHSYSKTSTSKGICIIQKHLSGLKTSPLHFIGSFPEALQQHYRWQNEELRIQLSVFLKSPAVTKNWRKYYSYGELLGFWMPFRVWFYSQCMLHTQNFYLFCIHVATTGFRCKFSSLSMND